MPSFKALALRWVSDEPQPGVIELSVRDAAGREHRILEKDVVTPWPLGSDARFPVELWIEAPTHEIDGDIVKVTLPWSMTTTDGETQLTMVRSELKP
jgi:hypothetical protein